MSTFIQTAANRDPALYHPEAAEQFVRLERRMWELHQQRLSKTCLQIFECYRHPLRQNYLLRERKTTKAGAYLSAHQFGLAADFAATTKRGWHWEVPSLDWMVLKAEAIALGLKVPLTWDPGHVQHPMWEDVFNAQKFYRPEELDS